MSLKTKQHTTPDEQDPHNPMPANHMNMPIQVNHLGHIKHCNGVHTKEKSRSDVKWLWLHLFGCYLKLSSNRHTQTTTITTLRKQEQALASAAIMGAPASRSSNSGSSSSCNFLIRTAHVGTADNVPKQLLQHYCCVYCIFFRCS